MRQRGVLRRLAFPLPHLLKFRLQLHNPRQECRDKIAYRRRHFRIEFRRDRGRMRLGRRRAFLGADTLAPRAMHRMAIRATDVKAAIVLGTTKQAI